MAGPASRELRLSSLSEVAAAGILHASEPIGQTAAHRLALCQFALLVVAFNHRGHHDADDAGTQTNNQTLPYSRVIRETLALGTGSGRSRRLRSRSCGR